MARPTVHARWLVGSLASTLFVVGCATAPPPLDAALDAGSVPRYEEDVRPILVANCVSCHRPGAIAPFALETFEQVAPLAARIAAVTRARTMPPYLADASGACGTWQSPRWLAEEDIATLERWAAAGAPRGDASLPTPSPPSLPTLTGDVRTVDLGTSYVPERSRADDYRCFVTAPPSTTTENVIGYDVTPGNPRVVHHVLVYVPTDSAATDAARALDAADDVPGYPCFGGAGIAVMGVVAAWAPGAGAVLFPEGTGIRLDAGRALVIQVHYNTLQSDGAPDRTSIALAVAPAVETEARLLPLANAGIVLAPRRSSLSTVHEVDVASSPLVTGPFHVFGVYPHMHTLGRALHVGVRHADGSEDCLIDVPRWSFQWQLLYFRDVPVTVLPTDTLVLECDYDTSARDTETRWGEGTADEMCLAGLFVDL